MTMNRPVARRSARVTLGRLARTVTFAAARGAGYAAGSAAIAGIVWWLGQR